MAAKQHNALVVLGPTASGKTHLGVRLAQGLGGEIISADSRQVYRGLDIGSGKDLSEYEIDGQRIPYHLIDIVDLDHEFSVFDYQKRFFQVFRELEARGILPVIVGGTGLYLEAVLKGYRMVEVPEDPVLRAELAALSDEELVVRLKSLKPRLHNTTDLVTRERLIRAIEIAHHSSIRDPEPLPEVKAVILGARWPREELRRRIRERLIERLEQGMVEEVRRLEAQGVSWERLEQLGLEYRYIAQFLQGKICNKNDLVQKLHSAICKFAKRQETWFRRMERNGTVIHWIPRAGFAAALQVIQGTQTAPQRSGAVPGRQ